MLNPVRGEASVKIGDGTYVLAADMEGLANLSQTVNSRSLHDLFERLRDGEVHATRSAIRAWVQSGKDADGKSLNKAAASVAAVRDYAVSDWIPVMLAMMAIMRALNRQPADDAGDDVGNPAAAST